MNLDSETLTLFRRDGSRLLILARRTVIRMAADVPTKTYKLDASSEGCTGLFYRKKNSDGSFSTDSDKDWPRNGFVFKVRRAPYVGDEGKEVLPGWVQLEDKPDKYLPVSGHGHTYLWPQEK